MTRKASACIVVLFLCAVVAWSEEGGRNTVSIGSAGALNLPLLGQAEFFLSYERQITPRFAVSGTVAGQAYPFAVVLLFFPVQINNAFCYQLDGQVHWYPFSSPMNNINIVGYCFHIDTGLGFNHLMMSIPSIILTSGLGWKFIIGRSRVKFVHNIGLRTDVFFPFNDTLKRAFYSEEGVQNGILIPFSVGLRYSIGLFF